MTTSKENFLFAKKTPNVKWNKMMTDAMAEATPNPWIPYANRQIGMPILPVFGKIKGGNSMLRSFLSRKSAVSPITAKPPIIIKA